MSFEQIILVVGGLLTLLNFGTAAWMILSGPTRKLRDIAEVAEQQRTELSTRVRVLEEVVHGMPSVLDLHKIELSLARMEGELKTMGAQLSPVADIAKRMQETLMQHRGGE